MVKKSLFIVALIILCIPLAFLLLQYQNKSLQLRTYKNDYFTINYPLEAKVVDVLGTARDNNPEWWGETIQYIRIDKSCLIGGEAYGVIRVTTLDTLGAIDNIKDIKSGLERKSMLHAEKPTNFNSYSGVELDYELAPFSNESKTFYKYVIIPKENKTYILGFETDSTFTQDFSRFITFRIID